MKTLYVCEGCDTEYDDAEAAIRCEGRNAGRRVAEVGDIVFARFGFGWYDGDRRWISNPDVRLKRSEGWKQCPKGDGNCFSSCCTWGFYYVVTAIDVHEHRIRYHLATRAMKRGYRSGYTYNQHHIRPTKVRDPSDYLVRSGRGLIGQKAATLL